MSDEVEAKETWVSAGLRYDAEDKKLFQVFFPIKDGPPDEKSQRIYKKGAFKGCFVGAVYDVTTTNEGRRVFTGGEKGPKYRRRYSDTTAEKKLCAEWEALDQGAKAEDEAARNFSHDKNMSALEESLEPVVAAMRKTNYQGRRGILVWVLGYLQRKGGV